MAARVTDHRRHRRRVCEHLRKRGVKFEDYDLPDLNTVNHVFSTEDEKCAWLTDTEGNILCLHQNTGPH